MAVKNFDYPITVRSVRTNGLLAICAAVVGFGIFIVAVAPGFFMILLGAVMLATGGTVAYLIFSHRPAP